MNKAMIFLKKDLTESDRAELRGMFAGCYFNLSDCINHGLSMYYSDRERLAIKWARFADKIVF